MDYERTNYDPMGYDRTDQERTDYDRTDDLEQDNTFRYSPTKNRDQLEPVRE